MNRRVFRYVRLYCLSQKIPDHLQMSIEKAGMVIPATGCNNSPAPIPRVHIPVSPSAGRFPGRTAITARMGRVQHVSCWPQPRATYWKVTGYESLNENPSDEMILEWRNETRGNTCQFRSWFI